MPHEKWDPAAERDLCVALLLSLDKSTRLNWTKASEAMHDLGHNFSEGAMNQRYSKCIVKDFRVRLGEDPAARKRGKQDAGDTPAKKAKVEVAAEAEVPNVKREEGGEDQGAA